ncbi:MAG: 50S ribosomal protein L23 [Clostridia bacterium]|jgi:large subunit ribosomal protein L23|nr:50S ribosomal protein L23 [Clostridia bacterium]
MNAYDIIRKPIITEKGNEGIANKKYTFVVAKDANKTQIKAAVEEIFKVKVKKVNTVNVRGKYKRQGRTEGYTSSYKKAYVQLTADSKAIEFFESMA